MDEEDMLMMENDGEGPKSPAYPEGPVCIYEPNIFLFAEPNADLARSFDLVINVAREVHNPFDVEEAKRKEAEKSPVSLPTASSVDSFATAFEVPVSSNDTPEKRPEYLHIPWDHNTSILSDLPKLVELLKKRSDEGKRILVHCQCGVSRSASLIVAYGLFVNSQQTVQEAYDFVKERSRWIGPNMSLIYQLSDWRARLTAQKSIRRIKGSTRGQNGENRPKLGHSRSTNSSDPTPFSMEKIEDVPMTAPLPEFRNMNTSMDNYQIKAREIPNHVRTRSDNGEMITGVEPGPMSAPPGVQYIPGSRSAENHGQGWGHGDAGTGYVPPPLPPSAAYPLEQESDVVGNLAGYPSRVDDYDGMPPPTPSFGPSGGFRFEQPLLKSHRKKRMPLNMNMENFDEPPPTPSFSGPKGGFFGSSFPEPSSSLPKSSLPTSKLSAVPKKSSPPTFKKPDLPIRHFSSSETTTISTPPSRLAPTPRVITPPASAPVPQPRNIISPEPVLLRKTDGLSRPNPEHHRRFPSIMSSFDQPPPSPTGIGGSYFPPVRMPSITSHRTKSSNSLKGIARSSNAIAGGRMDGRGGVGAEDLMSPESEMSPTPAFFQDPRSPNTGHAAMPTTRSIFDVL